MNIARILSSIGEMGLVLIPFSEPDPEALRRTEEEFELEGVFHLAQRSSQSLMARFSREFDAFCGDTEGVRLSEDDAQAFDAIREKYDVIWFQGVAIPNCLGRRRWPGSVLDIDDVPSQYFAAKAREAKDLTARLKALRKTRLWKKRERVLLDRFDVVGVCSESDRSYLGGSPRIHPIPNGYEVTGEAPPRNPAQPPRIGFIGTLRYAPNADGLDWFVKEVWPLVLDSIPDARLRLVGADTDGPVASRAKGVEGLGFVDDAAAEIASWTLTVVPILVGGGTRIKIAEAFGRRCPVVSTSLGAYGYTVENGVECLLADSASDFAESCIRLIEDRELADRIVAAAGEKYDRELSWESIAPKVGRAVRACMGRRETPVA